MNVRGGSWFCLGLLVLESELAPTSKHSPSCGSCRACLPACPTGALVAPGVLDARRCISYLTIEHRGPIERELRHAIGEWLFGCDLCQTACPFNHRAAERQTTTSTATWELDELDLGDLLRMDDDEFRRRFRATALWRPRREGLLRNALIVVANAARYDLLPCVRSMLDDPSPVLREAASWCLAELNDTTARSRLERLEASETVDWVRRSVREDLRRLAG
jgi:epoxyqueuosine reductase